MDIYRYVDIKYGTIDRYKILEIHGYIYRYKIWKIDRKNRYTIKYSEG